MLGKVVFDETFITFPSLSFPKWYGIKNKKKKISTFYPRIIILSLSYHESGGTETTKQEHTPLFTFKTFLSSLWFSKKIYKLTPLSRSFR